MSREWGLESISIKARLRVFFAAVVILMLFGSLLSFAQFRNVSGHAIRLARAEQRITALLQFNNGLITLMSELHRAAEHQQADQFESAAKGLLAAFERQSQTASPNLQDIALENERSAVLVGGIRLMLDAMPERISAFVQLAKRGDWNALHARLLNQTDHTDDVVAALVQQAQADLAGARERLTEELKKAQRRAVKALLVTSLLSLFVAAFLGTLLTYSITGPLSDLDAGTRAIAAGQFDHRIPVKGSDELARVAVSFNRSAGELSRLFEEAQRERTIAETAKTELQHRARELARANADLQQFAYSASHDLQEPVRTLALYSELLQRQYAGRLDARADEYTAVILRGARQAQQLTGDLLAYTRAAADSSEVEGSIDSGLVLDEVLSTLETSIRDQRCTITAGPLPLVKLSEVHLRQLLQNLISNAIKYRGTSDPKVQISAERQQEFWLFAVRDNGLGIDPQYTKKIFGLFKRLHGQEYPGTGIGLAICERVVERYGGQIWVESKRGEGSIFWFTLPAG
jgi:signal transduction histidine kinase